MLDCLATPTRRKLLFGMLYLSEGAPIGFIWLGLPTRLRAMDVPLDRITWLLALLILPWTLKFLWAPLIDLFRGPRWGFKQWILISQSAMALCLLPLIWLDVHTQFILVSTWLLLHAFSAATQDVSIDALCIQESTPRERGALNGWMQCGVLVGRAAMGGGSLVLEHWIGFTGVVIVLIGLVLCSATLLVFARENGLPEVSSVAPKTSREGLWVSRLREMLAEIMRAVRSRGIWVGLLFAATAPAAFKSLEAVLGPFLIDHGYSQLQVGQFTATLMIGGMILGSLFAGRFSHYYSGPRFLVFGLAANLFAIGLLAAVDYLLGGRQGLHLFAILVVVAFSIGWFTVALYHWLMNLTSPALAATQFTAFMAATNVCEAWSTSLFGIVQVAVGYSMAILLLTALSGFAAVVLLFRPIEATQETSTEA